MHFYGWKLGLKTGQYYLRTKAAVDAIQFTVEAEKITAGQRTAPQVAASSSKVEEPQEEEEGCTMCSA